jgi:hypothetical protein
MKATGFALVLTPTQESFTDAGCRAIATIEQGVEAITPAIADMDPVPTVPQRSVIKDQRLSIDIYEGGWQGEIKYIAF